MATLISEVWIFLLWILTIVWSAWNCLYSFATMINRQHCQYSTHFCFWQEWLFQKISKETSHDHWFSLLHPRGIALPWSRDQQRNYPDVQEFLSSWHFNEWYSVFRDKPFGFLCESKSLQGAQGLLLPESAACLQPQHEISYCHSGGICYIKTVVWLRVKQNITSFLGFPKSCW